MTRAARYTGLALFGLALVLLAAIEFVPFESKTVSRGGVDADVAAGPWGMHDVSASETNTTSWSQFDALPGLTSVRASGPLLITATGLVLAGGVLLFFRLRIFAGIAGLAGGIASGAFLTLMSAGVGDVSIALFQQQLHFDLGFYLSLGAILSALTASVFSFIALLIGPKDAPDLPDRPTISVEDPNAFNPLASRDARAFKADAPKDYKSFDVIGAPRTFKPRSPPETGKPAVDSKPLKGSGIGASGELPPARVASPVASPAPVPWKGASSPALKPTAPQAKPAPTQGATRPPAPASRPAQPGQPKSAAPGAKPTAARPAGASTAKPSAPAQAAKSATAAKPAAAPTKPAQAAAKKQG